MTKEEIINLATNEKAMSNMLKIQEIAYRHRFTLAEVYWDETYINDLASEIQKLLRNKK